MSRKLFVLISSIAGAVSAAAIALVTYFNPSMAEAINSSIDVGTVALVTICANFVKE